MPMSASVKLLCVAAVSAIAYLLGRRACTRQVEEAVEHAVDGAAVRPWFPKSDTTLQCPIRGEYILGMSREEMKAELEAFVAVYRRAPKIDQFGSGFFHYFALWTAIRKLRPVHVIESGVLRGVGSWFLRQAAGPHASMTFISPEYPTIYADPAPDSVYYVRRDDTLKYLKNTPSRAGSWTGFKDFTEVDWDARLGATDRNRTIIFFDDHQASPRRIDEAKRRGFKHLMFDDNYLPGFGDMTSLKMVCHGDDRLWRLLGKQPYWTDNLGLPGLHPNRSWFRGNSAYRLSSAEQRRVFDVFRTTARSYYEVPPVWSGPNRFRLPRSWWERLTVRPLLSRQEARRFVRKHGLDMAAEAKRYTHVAYVRV